MSHRRPRSLAAFALSAAAVAAVAAPAAGAATHRPDLARPCAGVAALPTPGQLQTTDEATLCLLNQERALHGLPALHANARLARAARGHSADMVHRRYFSHTAPGDVTFVARIMRTNFAAGARAWSIGENLAWGTGTTASPAGIVRMWMHSPEHRANILNPAFRSIGIGIAHGVPTAGGGGATYTTDFGHLS